MDKPTSAAPAAQPASDVGTQFPAPKTQATRAIGLTIPASVLPQATEII
jgi:hypothetical protein